MSAPGGTTGDRPVGSFVARLRAAEEAGNIRELLAAIPFSAFLGIDFALDEGHVGGPQGTIRGRLRFADHIVGNPAIPAIHGGAIATLLETTAIATVLWEEAPDVLPRPVTLTFDYLRSGRPIDTFATARIVRRGRRVCTVRVDAWQDDRERPIASAGATLLLG